jgi:hypothetical protein
MAPHDAANEKLASLLAALREATRPLSPVVTPSTSAPSIVVPDGELERLQGVIDGLKAEIGVSTFSLDSLLIYTLKRALSKGVLGPGCANAGRV